MKCALALQPLTTRHRCAEQCGDDIRSGKFALATMNGGFLAKGDLSAGDLLECKNKSFDIAAVGNFVGCLQHVGDGRISRDQITANCWRKLARFESRWFVTWLEAIFPFSRIKIIFIRLIALKGFAEGCQQPISGVWL